MKKLMLFLVALLLVACSKETTENMKESMTPAVDQVTGIATVKQGIHMEKKLDSVVAVDQQRVTETYDQDTSF